MQKFCLKLIFTIVTAIALVGCGGGGNSDDNSNWEKMVWDQDKWA